MAMVKVADWVMRFVADQGIRDLFLVTGGGAMHLNDAVGQTEGLRYVCTVHEQSAAMAAESYAKVIDGMGCCLVTTGPGGTNALTGVAGAWLDSTPMLILSGQVKRADLKGDSGVRQLGVQEVDIVAMAAPVTKYAVTVMDPQRIRWHCEYAVWLAQDGRPGPVWIDIPLDVQGASIETDSLEGFTPLVAAVAETTELQATIDRALTILRSAERPVLLIGNGVRLAGARVVMRQVVEQLRIPVLTTWPAHDLLPDDHPLMFGRPGPVAPRGANFTLQNADVLLSVGARLDNVVTGYAPQHFARGARKIVVDIDPAEMARIAPTVERTLVCDAAQFLGLLHTAATGAALPGASTDWLARCRAWKHKYPVVLPEYRDLPSGVSTYQLAETLAAVSASDDIFVSGSSGAGIEIFNLAMTLREGQRLFLTTALGAMGNGLPACIGAAVAAPTRRVISVDGDGGFQLNIQELELLRRLALDVKIFILANEGYASIRTSQQRYFGRLTGADATSGVTVPELRKVVEAFGLPWVRISDASRLAAEVTEVLGHPGPIICEVATPREEIRAPSLASAPRADGSMVSRPLEDLWPFLSREELHANLLIPPLPE
jgi:acetolactate synthase-1/2/3 large subunit